MGGLVLRADALRLPLADQSVDAICTDPPYGLEFMGQEWDRFTPSGLSDQWTRLPAPTWSRGAWTNKRCIKCNHIASGGSPCRCPNPEWIIETGKSTASAHAYQAWCEQWAAEALRVLKPGGHMLAFGGTRTYHRLASGIEDAGFEIRDSCLDCHADPAPDHDPLLGVPGLAWLHGQGFPKSLDVGKAIDRAAGAEREIVGKSATHTTKSMAGAAYGANQDRNAVQLDVTAPATEEAARWHGWGTALKPSWEPVICARKPFRLVPLGEGIHHGLGALLCLLSTANDAAGPSTSSLAEFGEGCASARATAVVDSLSEPSAATATFRSPEAASTAWNIASSWNAILAALSAETSTSTTETTSSMTTALRTLHSSLSAAISLTTMPPCGCLTGGPPSLAADAARRSSVEWGNWLHTLRRSAPADAIERTAATVAAVCASVAAALSTAPTAGGSSAGSTATTPATGRLSPSWGPVVVARKPLIGSVAANVLAFGTGGLNVDAARIGSNGEHQRPYQPTNHARSVYGQQAGFQPTNAAGRWPPNCALSHAPGCQPTGTRKVRTGTTYEPEAGRDMKRSVYGATKNLGRVEGYADADGTETVTAWTCEESCPVRLLDQQSGERKAGGNLTGTEPSQPLGGTVFGHSLGREGWQSYADQGGASRFFATFAPDSRMFYTAKAGPAERVTVDGISHPTQKPLDLLRWLVRLICPPGGVCLDMFAGSGTTAEACMLEGMRWVVCDSDPVYVRMPAKRTNPWTPRQHRRSGADPTLFD